MQSSILPTNSNLNSTVDVVPQEQLSIQAAQDIIYKFLIDRVACSSPEAILTEFLKLFFYGESSLGSKVNKALYEILFRKDEAEFRNTFKRSCYILINNWSSSRNYSSIQKLIQVLAEAKVKHKQQTLSPSLQRLRAWLINFIESEDYQELKLFALPATTQERKNWSHRYATFLLVPQYLNSQNPIEQRELAKNLAKRLKEKFKFELARYTIQCNSPILEEKRPSNPTHLGDEIIHLLKHLVSRKVLFSYSSYANLFIQQTQNLNYQDFKCNLQTYLLFAANHLPSIEVLKNQLDNKLKKLYEAHHQETLNLDLLLRTCRRFIEFLTIENDREPSSLFILLTTQESPLTLVITLLKIILLCDYVRTHLDICIAKLIRYYETYPEQDCQWFINFLDVFNIVFAIYTENVQYNLVKVDRESINQSVTELDTYRVFSQLRGADLRGSDLSGADIRSTDLSAADLRNANLSSADLSHADLSLAKLGNANLSSATLNGAVLIATNLNGTNLNGANLSDADLSRSDLRQANLTRANLTIAKLRRTNLQKVVLKNANLSGASLVAADLRGADLRQACLQNADLSDADLSFANLCDANLKGANLSRTKFHHTNLSNVNFTQANLLGATLIGACLAEANFNRADLNYGNFCGANLQGALLRHATLNHASLKGANLSHADLSHTNLSYADLRGTDLSNTLLRHVNLNGADLKDANLNGANLFKTDLSTAREK
ncbi:MULTISPECIES: pentapeptide repeat-containing protein [unclassified Coleofasciculus]|uniref:pentapeptide repeat-containing protein n=1 Tax=unclassified Coleofasciculus TaxID=2692782 RepID=UPI00187E66D5|nr:MULTISPECIES: pentapeptide repeat-containing protein [unclassified Coleofasciculus]MBE9125192.1 pentapeptide repeat-containing protein [Coleofasciculus sp. LEGE 07081]MBE9148769.1 pentapeptide repeat-containing protein [Coleofasciculus sp. LEGE 07092]